MLCFLQTSPKLFFMSWDNLEYFMSKYFNKILSEFSILWQRDLTAFMPLKLLEDKVTENSFGKISDKISRQSSFNLHILRFKVLSFPAPCSWICFTNIFILSTPKSLLWRSTFSICVTKLTICGIDSFVNPQLEMSRDLISLSSNSANLVENSLSSKGERLWPWKVTFCVLKRTGINS